MATGTGLSEYVTNARHWLSTGRKSLRELHDHFKPGDNAPGRRVVSGLSDLLDSILLLLFRNVVERIESAGESIDSRVAMVLHGGCGRREVAPYSDVDFMLLYRGESDDTIQELARQLTQDICDTGFQLGFSMRTPRDACTMALKDASIFSSLTESRFLGGSLELYENYLLRLKRLAQRRATHLIRSITAARQTERNQFGETVYLLRPNVKKSRGALRDIHMVRWIGFVRFGETDIDQLCRKGAIAANDAVKLNDACEFLLRLRNELHFHAGYAIDMFGKNEQVRVAEKFGYQGSDVFLPVEELMRDYFHHTSQVQHCCDSFVNASQYRRTIANVFIPLMSRPVDDMFRMGPFHIGVQPELLESVQTNLENVLRLMQLSIIHSKEIDPETWEAIRRAMGETREVQFTPETGRQFMALLENPARLGTMLRRLSELNVLEKIIPPFAHARSLLQFNEYHKYTVDEHSLLAVERATEFQDDSGPLGKAYRSLREKGLLHLALLIHDLGKGYTEDHSEVGRRLAEEICPRLGIRGDKAEDVKFLVHNHLMMSHVAFQRDINDASLVAEFAANVGSKKILSMLYLLTCADISAIGPDALSQWKFGLLTDLYHRAGEMLEGIRETEPDQATVERELAEFRQLLPDEESAAWVYRQAQSLPQNYYRGHPKDLIAEQLVQLRDRVGLDSECWVSYSGSTQMMELCIGRRVERRSGIYYRITGLLASLGLHIRTADIKHLDDSFVWYWFQFEDPNLSELPADDYLIRIREQAKKLADGKEEKPPSFPLRWQENPERSKNLPKPPIRVTIDNQTADWATVIDVFAYDRLGLLYQISKRIYELNLDVRFARIATFGMQTIDVFYVTDEYGQKIFDRKRLVRIRRALLETTQNFLETDKSPPQRRGAASS